MSIDLFLARFVLVNPPLLLRNLFNQLTIGLFVAEVSARPAPDLLLLIKSQFVDVNVFVLTLMFVSVSSLRFEVLLFLLIVKVAQNTM